MLISHRMGHWQDRLVFVRSPIPPVDSAWPAAAMLAILPASTFTERRRATFRACSHSQIPDSGAEGESASESELDALSDAPSQSRSESDSALQQPRPLLAHRIHSHRLRAKLGSRRAELLGSLIDIYVDESNTIGHSTVTSLCHHSEHLASILLPDETKKKAENKLDLLDDDPAGFELLVKWLYQGKLDDVSIFRTPIANTTMQSVILQNYLLCDRFKDASTEEHRHGPVSQRP